MVERPRSALSGSPRLPQPRRRPSVVEVIDVDEFEEASPSRPTSRPESRQHRPAFVDNMQQETIILTDSDEGDFTPPAASRSGSTRSGQRRQRLTSPPPPAAAGPSRVPPVPPVPRRYSALTSLPSSPDRRPPPFPSPPVVLPMNEPFPFERNGRTSPPAAGPSAVHVHPNRHRRIPYVEPRAEPQPHHVPSLGLGGALMTLNRARDHDASRRERHRHLVRSNTTTESGPPGFLARAGNTMRRLFTRVNYHGDDEDDEDDFAPMQLMLAENLGLDVGNFDRFENPARGWALHEMLFRNRERMSQRHQEVEYKREYTHPGQPESGFTFDFASPEPSAGAATKPTPIVIDLEADSDDVPIAGPSTEPSPPSPTTVPETILVCARCMDPLVLGGGLVGEEGRKKKVWALRCGHMIDGKCLDIIGNPESNVPTVEATESVAKALESKGAAGKGKGKARADDDAEVPFVLEDTIRSRLRSRGHPPVMPPVTPESPARAATAISTSVPSPPSTLGKRKRSIKPRVEATYEWKCPVPSCGRTHASVKVDGSWVPEPINSSTKGKGKGRAGTVLEGTTASRGAIAVFV
ncbi:hypothetical protein LshimejAT787_1801380 [Lyophyllum shimeji]|uniref:Uncharacterized protein n=1 Tax=Lyophyllum shimeji TaxID=47721 RepID=A0A9P3UW59_LYOSH|nr:hypothetical protein LshimejAT787_1801380 [Lyophyllum shimeji]